MTRQKQEVGIEYCWNIQTKLDLHSWATHSQKSLNFAQNRQVVYFAESLWKLDTHALEEHGGMHYFSLLLQLHQDNLLVYQSRFPKQALKACFRFYHSYISATSITLTNFRSKNLIFHLESLFQNKPPSSGGKMTTPLKIRRYYTGHINMFP